MILPKIACTFIFCSFAIYFYIHSMNDLIELRLKIPEIQKKVRDLRADNTRLVYEIDRFESPEHLMELLRTPEFSHLRTPYYQEIVIIP